VPFRRVAAGVLVLAVALAAFVLTRGGEESRPPAPHRTPAPHHEEPAPPVLDRPVPGGSLAVGITEANPNLIAKLPGPAIDPAWGRRRDQLVRMRPALYRVVVPWSGVQPDPGTPPTFTAHNYGCVRDKQPCAPFAGLRDQLRAVAARGAQAMVVFVGLPPWAMAHVRGCERGTSPTAGSPRPAALGAFRLLVEDVLAEARADGADVRYVSPWNEPNHPYALAPQRERCDPGSPSLAASAYVKLAKAAQDALAVAPGDQELVIGETAGVREPSGRATSLPEMIRALPRSLVCASRVWSQHAYIGGTDPVALVTKELDARHCPHRHVIWITETGVGPAPGGLSLARGITSEAQGCRLLHRRLLDWYRNPRVTLAVQYTFREDDLFPTGLVTTDLRRARPALAEWQAWGGDRAPDAPPPPSTCSPNGG
jgi:hypothetical protein